MDRSEQATLIAVTYSADSIGQKIPVETTRTVFCSIGSVSQSEFFEAGRNGFQPELRLTMFAPDYENETIVQIGTARYGVYRTYRGKNDTIELYLERKAGV